jgi:hypothetical protein
LGRNEYEHEVIEKIVKEVTNKINRDHLHVANYPVGLEPRVLCVKSRLDVGGSDNGVYMLGIYGEGGMGKSSLQEQLLISLPINLNACVFFIM